MRKQSVNQFNKFRRRDLHSFGVRILRSWLNAVVLSPNHLWTDPIKYHKISYWLFLLFKSNHCGFYRVHFNELSPYLCGRYQLYFLQHLFARRNPLFRLLLGLRNHWSMSIQMAPKVSRTFNSLSANTQFCIFFFFLIYWA